MDPGAHGELGDEDIAAFGEEDGRFGRDHLHFRIGLHHLLDAGQRQVVLLIVVVGSFDLGDLLLPVGVENVAVVA